MAGSGPPSEEAAPAGPAAQPDEDAEPAIEAAAEEPAADEPDADTDADDESDEDETPADPETAKRLDVVRRAEKRARAQADAREAELTAREQRMADRLARLDEIERLAARAKYDPAAVLRAMGLTDDDFETVGQAIYAESKVAQSDPKRKEIAAKLLREREQADKLTAIERRAQELEQKLERQREESEVRAEAARYFEQLNTTASTKHPLVAHLLKADPDDTQHGLVAAYERMMTKTKGAPPAAAAVVAEYDRAARAKFKRLGVDPDALIGKPAAAAAAATPGAKPKPAAAKKPADDRVPTREELIAELSSGAFADS
jgi:hypothetical protein